MSSQTVLQPTATSNSIDVNNVQGDIVIGLSKRVEAFVFLTIKDDEESRLAFRRTLKAKLLPLITTTQQVLDTQAKIDESKRQTKPGQSKKILPITHINISFSASGLKKLGVGDTEIPSDAKAFIATQKSDAVTNLGDPVDQTGQKLSTWSDEFLQHSIDAVILITAPDETLLESKMFEVENIVKGSVSHQFVLTGNVRPGSEAGHEHFGYLDGISKPKIEGFNATEADKKAGVVKPSVILVGQADTQQTKPLDPAQSWMKDGSFLVFRQLQQLVPEFRKFCQDVADKNPQPGVTGEFIGARIVGRWKSGAPLVLAPVEDNPELATADNFDFSDDLVQQRCPYAAHIRKTNPRNGIEGADPNTAVLPHLITRSGIPYGPELTQEEIDENKTKHNRGLLFVCYQSKLEDGFKLVQEVWSNNPDFPPKNPAKVTTGLDLLIGQNGKHGPRTAQNITSKGTAGDTDPNNTITSDELFVHPLGGEYFFSPSLEAIKTKLGA
ncbi:hypothetical protein DFH28DRAFT_960272 [Melampsora americana]|nr:hypothetical protein DFH28DRAFT_960272 [Melampsora americana]